MAAGWLNYSHYIYSNPDSNIISTSKQPFDDGFSLMHLNLPDIDPPPQVGRPIENVIVLSAGAATPLCEWVTIS
jgi:hypothetical protein